MDSRPFLNDGSIPACAGEPPRVQLRRCPGRVYPRVCGGTSMPAFQTPSQKGLSPRVRGNPADAAPRRGRPRSIPACAGEPPGLPIPGHCGLVYPRVCGGTFASRSCPDGVGGLSPRVRGNRPRTIERPVASGSIPACAGEPARSVRLAAVFGVYPRVCGGTVPRQKRCSTGQGLSPRVRGNHPPRGRTRPKNRSIPACAGEPNRRQGQIRHTTVYPRVCGGTSATPAITVAAIGLSPRVRGNLVDDFSVCGDERSIPACAGEPAW